MFAADKGHASVVDVLVRVPFSFCLSACCVMSGTGTGAQCDGSAISPQSEPQTPNSKPESDAAGGGS
eukprot:2541824-Rhodomonas_salina.3